MRQPLFIRISLSFSLYSSRMQRLEFEHPSTGEHMVFKSEPEGDVFDVIELDEF